MQIENSKKCSSTDKSVSYIYGELSEISSYEFEDHLVECELCRDVFAEVSDARFSVYEWHKLEFVPMRTPRFTIPFETKRAGWFAGIRQFFASPQRLVASASFAAFALVAAITFGVFTVSDTAIEIASDRGSTETAGDDHTSEESRIVDPPISNLTGAVETVAETTPDRIPVRKSVPPQRLTVKKPASRDAAVPIQTSAPRLNDFDDTGDESLRLSDIFDDIETSD